MGTTVNTGKTNAVLVQNITGGANAISTCPGIPSGATLVTVCFLGGTSITTSYQTKYTPTATKTFILVGCSISNATAIEFADAGTPKIVVTGNTAGDAIRHDNLAPVQFTTTVQLKGVSAYTAYGSFWGYEVG